MLGQMKINIMPVVTNLKWFQFSPYTCSSIKAQAGNQHRENCEVLTPGGKRVGF